MNHIQENFHTNFEQTVDLPVTCGAMLLMWCHCLQDPTTHGIDPKSMLAIQLVVLGLTFTEWVAKAGEEDFTVDLLTAMATDLFHAYDVYEFFDVNLHEDKASARSNLF